MKNKSNLTDIKIANRVIDEFREQTLRQSEIIYSLSNELYILQEKKDHYADVISEFRDKINKAENNC